MPEPLRLRHRTTATLTVLSGARAGHCHRLIAEFATVGQAPAADLTFDPAQDPAVALRHAAVFRHGGGYVIRDLGAKAGTWVNDARVRGELSLEPGDRIRLGSDGPALQFDIMAVEDAEAAIVLPAVAVPTDGARTSAPHRLTGATGLGQQIDVVRQTERLRRRLAIAVILAVAAVAGGAAWATWARVQHRAALERERDRILARVDSVQRALDAPRERAQAMRPMLDSLDREVADHRARLSDGVPGASLMVSVDTSLDGTIHRSAVLLVAARFDPGFAMADHGPGMASVHVLVPEQGHRIVGGVVVASRGDTAWVVTLRDAVMARDGRPYDSLGVAMARARQARRARVVATDPAAGLALLRLIPGPAPRVVRLPADTAVAIPTTGDAVAVVGIPPMAPRAVTKDWRRLVVPASAAAATVVAAGDSLRLDLYTAARSGGSAVFSAEGRWLGMLASTGITEGRAVRMIPVARIAALVRGADQAR